MLTTTEQERIRRTAIEQAQADRIARANAPDDDDEPEPEDRPDPWADEGQSDARELARDRYDD